MPIYQRDWGNGPSTFEALGPPMCWFSPNFPVTLELLQFAHVSLQSLLQNGGCSVIKCIYKKYFSKVSITFKPCATGLETAPCPFPLGKPVHDNEIVYEFRNKLARRQPQMFPSRQKT